MIIFICAEKAFDKIKHPFMIKTFNKLDMEGTFFNTIKTIYEKLIVSIILNEEKLEIFLLKSRTKKDVPCHHCYSI